MSDAFINILIAEDNDVSREMMAGILRTKGYRVYGAINGESAIKVVEDREIDLALVDVNMAPTGGFEFLKYLVVKGLNIPSVIITSDESSHILREATSLGARQVLQKPVTPDRLLQIVERLVKNKGLNPRPLTVSGKDSRHSPEELMTKAIALAERNYKSRYGGPFGAIVADKDGKILGEGVNGIASRADPTAHAEVMAIRKAAEKLGRADLSDCLIYCTAEPTSVGKAMIESVGIQKVFYGVSGEETRAGHKAQKKPTYTQMARDQALLIFEGWKNQKN